MKYRTILSLDKFSRNHQHSTFAIYSASSIIQDRNRYYLTRSTDRKSFATFQPSPGDNKRQNNLKWENTTIRSLITSFESTSAGLKLCYERINDAYSRIASSSYGRLMRLDKPIGYNLLFLPGAWSICLASSSMIDFLTLSSLFYTGAIVMRGAGCTINDIWDVDIDKQVARTKSRPLASGEISIPAAFAFLGAQLGCGLWILTRLNTETFLVGSLSVLPVLFYPFAKRKTYYPQAVLGLTFNSGALLGYTAATGSIGLPALLLYGAGWCWTMVYDTIYGHQDKTDDKLIGVYSTALTFNENTKRTLGVFTFGKLMFLTGAGLAADLSLPYFMGITASCIHVGHQVYSTDLDNAEECRKAFVSNQTCGLITCGAILAGRLL